MKNYINVGVIVFLLFLFSGCWAPKTILTTSNITQPVLVGKVKTIGGEPIENSILTASDSISASLTNSIFYYSTLYFYGYSNVFQGSNLIDTQLLPFIEKTPNDPSAMLIANKIRFKAAGGYWLVALYSANKGWIDIKKYNKPNEIK